MSTDSPPAWTSVLGRIPSGVFILTLRAPDGWETGLLCSWVQQVAFDPPMVAVAIRQDRPANDWLRGTQQAVLNILGEDGKSFLGHFGKGFPPGAPSFDGLELERCPRGLPILSGALGHLELEHTGAFDAGDHTVHTLRLTGGALREPVAERKPMVHIRKSGTHY